MSLRFLNMCLRSIEPAKFSKTNEFTPSGGKDFLIKVTRIRESPSPLFNVEGVTLSIVEIDGKHVCFAFELPDRFNIPNISRVPAGVYPNALIRYYSEYKDKRIEFWRVELKLPRHLIKRLSRTNVQIHMLKDPAKAVVATNSRGCLVVGSKVGIDGKSLTGSDKALNEIKKSFYGSDTPKMTPNRKIVVDIVDAIKSRLERSSVPGQSFWRLGANGATILLVENYLFSFDAFGNWQFAFTGSFISSSYSKLTIEFIDFDILGYDDDVLFTLRVCENITLYDSSMSFNAVPLLDDRITKNWLRIEKIGSCRGRGIVSQTKKISVPADNPNGITTGLKINKGDMLDISAIGTWSWGESSDANGTPGRPYSEERPTMLDGEIFGKLIGSIGSKKFSVGSSAFIIASEQGEFFLLMNDRIGFYHDNKGSITVTVTVNRTCEIKI